MVFHGLIPHCELLNELPTCKRLKLAHYLTKYTKIKPKELDLDINAHNYLNPLTE